MSGHLECLNPHSQTPWGSAQIPDIFHLPTPTAPASTLPRTHLHTVSTQCVHTDLDEKE